MAEVSNELIYEVLKSIQAQLTRVIEMQSDHTRQLLRLREDDLRRETMQIHMDTRLDRIETRLNLSDAE